MRYRTHEFRREHIHMNVFTIKRESYCITCGLNFIVCVVKRWRNTFFSIQWVIQDEDERPLSLKELPKVNSNVGFTHKHFIFPIQHGMGETKYK